MGTLNKILLHHRQKKPAIYHQMIDLRLPHRYNKHNLSWIQKKIHFFANSCKYISLKLELWYCHSWCNGNIFIRIRNIQGVFLFCYFWNFRQTNAVYWIENIAKSQFLKIWFFDLHFICLRKQQQSKFDHFWANSN